MKRSKTEKEAPKFVIIDSIAQQTARSNKSVANAQQAVEARTNLDTGRPQAANPPRQDQVELRKHKIIYLGMQDQEVLNAFRSIRLTLQSKMQQFNSVVLVSSVSRGGGATFAAANLGAAFTFEPDKHALIVDCNFADPDLAGQLGVENHGNGIYDYLIGNETNIASIIHPTVLPRVNLIPARHPGTSSEGMLEVLTGKRMVDLLAELRARYPDRVIILDAPPILDSADTKILAGLSDYRVVTVPYAHATSSRVDKTVSEFAENTITGFVMVN